MIFTTIITFVLGYFIGAFPTAYLLLKRKGVDITEKGSGNVGALNASRVGSKAIGVTVFIIDALKGFLAVKIALLLFGNTFLIGGTALLAAVLGHCFSVYIKFKGGRGLATALGGSLIIAPQLPALWILLWLIAFIYKRNVHFANGSATFLLMLLSIFSGKVLYKYSAIKPNSIAEFVIISSLTLFIILIKHYKPLKEYFTSQKINRGFHE